MSYQYVNVVTINKVAVIEFNYGRKLNALSKVGNGANLLI